MTKGSGLLPPNHWLAVCVHYLFSNRKSWRENVVVGKAIVSSSSMINRVSARLQRSLYQVLVGLGWFVEGLPVGRLGFGGDESACPSFLRRDGSVWTTDKDGTIPRLLSAEITARLGKAPGEIYRELTRELESCLRTDRRARDARTKSCSRKIVATDIHATEVAGWFRAGPSARKKSTRSTPRASSGRTTYHRSRGKPR